MRVVCVCVWSRSQPRPLPSLHFLHLESMSGWNWRGQFLHCCYIKPSPVFRLIPNCAHSCVHLYNTQVSVGKGSNLISWGWEQAGSLLFFGPFQTFYYSNLLRNIFFLWLEFEIPLFSCLKFIQVLFFCVRFMQISADADTKCRPNNGNYCCKVLDGGKINAGAPDVFLTLHNNYCHTAQL